MDKFSANSYMDQRWKSNIRAHRDSFSDIKSEFSYDQSDSALNKSVLNLQASSRKESMHIYENSYKQITAETTQIPFSKVPLLSFQGQLFQNSNTNDSTPLSFSGLKRPKVVEQDMNSSFVEFTTPPKKSISKVSGYREQEKLNPREKRVKIMSKQTMMDASFTSSSSPDNVKSIKRTSDKSSFKYNQSLKSSNNTGSEHMQTQNSDERYVNSVIKTYEEALNGVNTEIKKLLEKNSHLENEVKRVQFENTELNEKYKSHMEEAFQKVEELNEQIEMRNEKIDQLSQKSQEKDAYYGNMEREFRRNSQNMERMKEQEKELREKMKAMNQRILEFEMKERAYEDEIFNLGKENNELKSDLMNLIQREQAYKQELNEEISKRRNAELEKSNLSKINQLYMSTKNDLDCISEQFEKLKIENEAFKKEKEEVKIVKEETKEIIHTQPKQKESNKKEAKKKVQIPQLELHKLHTPINPKETKTNFRPSRIQITPVVTRDEFKKQSQSHFIDSPIPSLLNPDSTIPSTSPFTSSNHPDKPSESNSSKIKYLANIKTKSSIHSLNLLKETTVTVAQTPRVPAVFHFEHKEPIIKESPKTPR